MATREERRGTTFVMATIVQRRAALHDASHDAVSWDTMAVVSRGMARIRAVLMGAAVRSHNRQRATCRAQQRCSTGAVGDCDAGSSSSSGRDGSMANKNRQGAGHSEAVCHHDDGHCAKANGMAHACLLASHSDAEMQEQLSYGLLSTTAETIIACTRQGAGCESTAGNNAEEPGAKSTMADHCEVQAWAAMAHAEKSTTALLHHADAQGIPKMASQHSEAKRSSFSHCSQ